jgi:secreted trypsin-like serine protease
VARRLLDCSTLAGTGCVIGDEGDDLGDSDESILGGTVDTGDPAVVQLRYNQRQVNGISTAGCTGTVIAPTVILTAAHCVPFGAYNVQYNPSPSANPFDANSPGWIATKSIAAHPAFYGNPSAGHDIGVVILNTPTTIAPIALGTSPAAGSTVRAVGYGRNQPAATGGLLGGGVKRTVNMSVSSVAAHEFVAGVDLVGTCHGDSGGPIFQGSVIVGTTSYGSTADCHQAGHYMRIDDNRAFLDTYLRGSGALTACIAACHGNQACIAACVR